MIEIQTSHLIFVADKIIGASEELVGQHEAGETPQRTKRMMHEKDNARVKSEAWTDKMRATEKPLSHHHHQSQENPNKPWFGADAKEQVSPGPLDYIRKSYSNLGLGGAQKPQHKESYLGRQLERGEKFKERMRESAEDAEDVLKRKGEKWRSQARGAYETSKDQLKNIGEDIGERGTEAWYRWGGGKHSKPISSLPASKRWEKMKERTSDWYQELQERGGEALGTTKDRLNVDEMMENAKGGYESMSTRVRQPFKTMPEQIHRMAHKFHEHVPLYQKREPKTMSEWLAERLYDMGEAVAHQTQKLEAEETSHMDDVHRKTRRNKTEKNMEKRFRQIWAEKVKDLKEAFEEFKEQTNTMDRPDLEDDPHIAIERMENHIQELENLLEKERFRLDFFRKELEVERHQL
jgi:hypothetical protein